jgi:hypothetical protein
MTVANPTATTVALARPIISAWIAALWWTRCTRAPLTAPTVIAPEAAPVVTVRRRALDDNVDGDENDGDGGDALAFDAALARTPLQVECLRNQVRLTWRGRELSSAGNPSPGS